MIYTLYLTQEGRTGQIPITDEEGKPFGSIRGRLDNPNHTLYLLDTSGNEIGRLFSDGTGLIASFTLDVVHHSLVHVKKVNSPLTNLFYITRLNYWVNGSIKQGSYYFRDGFKKVASVDTVVADNGGDLDLPDQPGGRYPLYSADRGPFHPVARHPAQPAGPFSKSQPAADQHGQFL